MEPVEAWVEVPDGRLWTISQGSGPPILLHPGGPGLCDYLAPVARLLTDSYQVVRLDPRGCGRSDAMHPLDLTTCLADLEQVRQALGHEQWFVGGHSYGADISLAYALTYPDRTLGVLYLAGTGLQNDRQWHATYSARTDDEVLPEFAYPWNQDVNRQVVASWRAFLKTPDLYQRVAGLEVPFLVVCGGRDIRPGWPAEQLARLLPNALLEILPEADHMLWRRHEEALGQLLLEFLAAPPRTGAQLVYSLWEAMEGRQWDRVEALLAPDFQAHWPQSGERFDRAGYLKVNRHYPGDWHLQVSQVIQDGEWVVSQVEVALDGRQDRAVSWFRVRGQHLVELREHWPDPFPVPKWRRSLP